MCVLDILHIFKHYPLCIYSYLVICSYARYILCYSEENILSVRSETHRHIICSHDTLKKTRICLQRNISNYTKTNSLKTTDLFVCLAKVVRIYNDYSVLSILSSDNVAIQCQIKASNISLWEEKSRFKKKSVVRLCIFLFSLEFHIHCNYDAINYANFEWMFLPALRCNMYEGQRHLGKVKLAVPRLKLDFDLGQCKECHFWLNALCRLTESRCC